MNRERWQQVDKLYHAALERDEAERAAFLREACAGDDELRREVESLLVYAGQAEDFMESPALGITAIGLAQARANSLLGTQFGSYKVISLLGSGGMGEVYLAKDQSLDRKVALKFLPEEVLQDVTARRRFLREAKSAAALDHPYVCNVFEVGEAEGRAFIAMEYVDGQTLGSRLRQGPLPLKEALQIIAEVAEALVAAHAQGIIHRDLKPSNIMLTKSGHTKVMDFGLAKRVVSDQEPERTDSALTLVTPAGLAVGTPAYMSPEQLRGQRLDARSDIFSFGIVCYQMLTGVHPFERPELTETIGAILKEDPPPPARYREEIPEILRHMVRKMLAKEPASRFQSAHEIRTDVVAIQQDSLPTGPVTSPIQPATRAVPWKTVLPWVLLPVVALATWVLSRALRPEQEATSIPRIRFTIKLPEGKRLTSYYRHGIAVSPDGGQLAFVGGTVGQAHAVPSTSLYVRGLDQRQVRSIPGTENALNPVFSPDGKELVFLDGPSLFLKRVAVEGGKPVTLCECSAGFGVDWGAENTIIFGSVQGLQRVSASGGDPEVVTQLDKATGEVGHFLPRVLPGGKAVLFTAVRYKNTGTKDWKRARILAQSLETGARKFLIEGGSDARYVPTGHLVFAREGRLMAVPFDLARLEVAGSPAQVLEGIHHSIYSGSLPLETGAAQFSFSDNGLLAYVAGSVLPELKTVVAWVDRQGREKPLEIEPKSYFSVRFSPHGKQVLLTTLYPPRDVWLYDLERKLLRRQTFEGNHTWAVWGPRPDAFTSDSDVEGPDGIYLKTVDSGPSQEEKLPTGFDIYHKPSSWSPDGRTLALVVLAPETGNDIWMFSSRGKVDPFLRTRFSESFPEFSPDGRWLAYVSDESRREEVYVRPYPGPGGPVRVSRGGGLEPGWSRDGKEIHYRWGAKFLAARIDSSKGLKVDEPIVLFERSHWMVTSPVRSWDVSADGRFLLLRGPDESAMRTLVEEINPTEIHLVQNWFEELRRLAPTDQ